MKLFGWSFNRNRVGRFCWTPRRLTLRCNPAIYKWMGVAFSPYWSHEIHELRDQRDRYRAALETAITLMDDMYWHVADSELRLTAVTFSARWHDILDAPKDSE